MRAFGMVGRQEGDNLILAAKDIHQILPRGTSSGWRPDEESTA